WAAGSFTSDWAGIPAPPVFGNLQPAQQIEQLERSALHDCLGGPFHPGIELTWTLRLPGVWASAYRLKVRPGNDPAQQDYGSVLTPDVCIEKAYDGVAAGSLTRFLGVPWQTDGTSCNSDVDYRPSTYLSMPTFWGPRVPDQVLALSDYERAAALDPASNALQTAKHFSLRSDWLRDVRGRDYYARLLNMIADWHHLGQVLPVANPPSHLPLDTRVELGRNVPGFASFADDPKYKLVKRIETLDGAAPLAAANTAVAEIANAAKLEEAGEGRPVRHFRRGEV